MTIINLGIDVDKSAEKKLLEQKWREHNENKGKKPKENKDATLAWCKHRLRLRGSLMNAETQEEYQLRLEYPETNHKPRS